MTAATVHLEPGDRVPLTREQYLALDVGLKPARDEFGPDAMVIPRTAEDAPRFAGMPPMVCEVLSEDRSRDPVTKLRKYERARAPQHWVVDPRDREILGFRNTENGHEEYARVDCDRRAGTFFIAIREGIPVTLRYEQFFS